MDDEDRRKELEDVLKKPLQYAGGGGGIECFDPWNDIIHGIDGSYNAIFDWYMVKTLKAVHTQTTFDVIEQYGPIVEFMLNVLSGHGLTEYGTSPRGGFPSLWAADLWPELIEKWEKAAKINWADDWENMDLDLSIA